MGLWDRLRPDEKKAAGKKAAHAGRGPTVGEAIDTAHDTRQEVWGRPGRCPVCGGRGYLDRIDVVDRVMWEHCTECGHKWSVAESRTTPAPN